MTVTAAVLMRDKKEMRRLIDEAAKNSAQMPDAPMALLIAVRAGREDIAKYLLANCPDIDVKGPCCDKALLFAVKNGRAGLAEALLEKGADVNVSDDWGESALHHATRTGDLNLVRMLLEKGADVDAANVRGNAPLMRALEKPPNVEIVKALLEKGASPNAGVTFHVLGEAVRNREILELLKAYGLQQLNENEPPSQGDD